MAGHSIHVPLEIPDRATHVEPDVDSLYGSDEINLGAFRGLAFALIFETLLVIFGSLGWELWRLLR
jgi:hypothetical protein